MHGSISFFHSSRTETRNFSHNTGILVSLVIFLIKQNAAHPHQSSSYLQPQPELPRAMANSLPECLLPPGPQVQAATLRPSDYGDCSTPNRAFWGREDGAFVREEALLLSVEGHTATARGGTASPTLYPLKAQRTKCVWGALGTAPMGLEVTG